MIKKELFDEIVNRLVDTYKPEKIYLFGSYAWGVPTEDSDIDLAIIVEQASNKRIERTKQASVALRGIPVSKDIIVYTKNEFNKALEHPSTLAKKIEQEGRVLYAKA